MTTLTIAFELDTAVLSSKTDSHLAQLWHIAQANPAPFGDVPACEFAEAVGREIIARWMATTSIELWTHQGRHARACRSNGRLDDAVLFEHSDGRWAVAASADSATFTRDDPDWHRAGPVDINALCGRA